MNQKPHFESYRYPNEVLVSALTRGLAWLLWAIVGVFLVAGILATNGLLFPFLCAVFLLIVGVRSFATWRAIRNTVMLSKKAFPNLSAIVHEWKLAMEDPYHAQVFLGGPGNSMRILSGLKRPVIVVPDATLSALTISGTLDEAQFALTQTLARAKLTADWEWYVHLPLYLSLPTMLLPLYLARLRTLSADRIALAVTNKSEPALRAVLISTIGPLLAPRIESPTTIGRVWPGKRWLATVLYLFSTLPTASDRIDKLGASVHREQPALFPKPTMYYPPNEFIDQHG